VIITGANKQTKSAGREGPINCIAEYCAMKNTEIPVKLAIKIKIHSFLVKLVLILILSFLRFLRRKRIRSIKKKVIDAIINRLNAIDIGGINSTAISTSTNEKLHNRIIIVNNR
jgi:hypothetical protein